MYQREYAAQRCAAEIFSTFTSQIFNFFGIWLEVYLVVAMSITVGAKLKKEVRNQINERYRHQPELPKLTEIPSKECENEPRKRKCFSMLLSRSI